jgi:hypothetical protein
MKLSPVTPLSALSPLETPDCNALLTSLKESLNRASSIDLWSRMERNHYARHAWWPGQHPSCVRPLVPGQPRPMPWPNCADLRVRLVDTVIKEYGDLLDLAERRVVPRILPAMGDPTDDVNMAKAASWGSVFEYYNELAEYELQRAKSQWRGIAWEYGHGVVYVGWDEQRQMQKKTLSAEQVMQLIAMEAVQGMEESGMQVSEQVADAALAGATEVVMDKTLKPSLVDALQRIDPEMTPREAKRVAGLLKRDAPVDYYVPKIVRAAPEMRALTPGLDVFYPPETTSIQKAPHITMPEWWSDVDMKANVTTREWNEKAVEAIIEKCTAGRSSFLNSIVSGWSSGASWLLTGGMVGMGVQYSDATDKNCRQWQLIRVSYRASDPETGVPVLYTTIFHPDLPDQPVFHGASVDDHAQYPYREYVREPDAPTMWASRGIGELSFSEQEEIRFQANFCFDNAAITIRPPYEVNSRSEIAVGGLAPGQRVTTSSTGQNRGVQKIDIGGDAKNSIDVQSMALARANNYHKMGAAPEMNPIAQQTAQQARVNEWVLAVKQANKMIFATIQQHCPEVVKATAINGNPANLEITREEIQGEFSIFMEFDVATLDPKALEARAKMVREFVAPLDKEGLLQLAPLLKEIMMGINPTWGKMVSTPNAAKKEQEGLAIMNAMRALLGLEPEYISGGNPKLRLGVTQKILSLPALDEKGEPIVDEVSGQPLPGYAQTMVAARPDVKALFINLMKHEQFESDQQENVEIGRIGVEPIQQAA